MKRAHLIGYKKVYDKKLDAERVLVLGFAPGTTIIGGNLEKLTLNGYEDEAKLSRNDGKWRASQARVLRAETLDGKKTKEKEFRGYGHDRSFVYKVGEVVTPSRPFDEHVDRICASGIHFFMNKKDAVNY